MAFTKKALAALAIGIAAATALTGCGRVDDTPTTGTSTPAETGAASGLAAIIVGTTDKSTNLDPAGSYDHGSLLIETQVYSFVYGFKGDSKVPEPDAAEKCEFISDTVFSCILKAGLKFANGHDLTSSDIKFSYDRLVAIDDPNGPASLVANLASVDAPDPLTVNFNLTAANDQTFLQVLATSAGPIVDEEVFSATELTPEDVIVDAKATSGPYQIDSWKTNDTVVLKPYADYKGLSPVPANSQITLKTYTDATNLKLAVTTGEIDVAYRSLTPTDIESLQKDATVKVWQGQGGEIRYIVFNLQTQPGSTDAEKFAIRQAIASSIDREALAINVYKSQYTPLCSWIPDGYLGATQAVCDKYPLDKDAAAKYLADAGLTTPVALNIQYNPDHYGSSSDQEYGLIKQQLEATDLFTVNLQSTEWVTYNKERVQDTYPIYQLGWFPDFPDADNYLTPFFTTNNFLKNHFDVQSVNDAILGEATEVDAAAREQQIKDIQTDLAANYLSTLPLLQGSQWAFSSTTVAGIELGVDELLHFATITKS